MITRRLASAFIIALIISGIFTLWLNQKFSKAKPAPPAPKNQYVAASVNLESGQIVRADNLRLVDWPASMPLPGAFTTTQPVVGRVVLYPLSAGEPIIDRQLAAPGSGSGLTVKIPDGMRAISLRSDEIVGVAGFLLPGTHVDVLLTLRTTNGSTTDSATSTILQDVEVLATGQKTAPDPEGKPSTSTVVTLLVKPEDAERVVMASSQGSVHFALRNGDDRQEVKGNPVLLSQLSGATPPPPPPEPQKPAVKQIQVIVPKPYTVETILGTKSRTDSFE
jgi:pilus assembly protein CpaB